MKTTLRHIYLCRTANMSWRTCVVVKQIQSNPILSSHGSCAAQCRYLLWLNVLLAGNWRRRYWQLSHLPDHESPLGIERQRHLCPLLLGAKPLWHRGEWDSGPASKGDFADLKPLVNSYIQQEVQIKWDVSIHGRDLYLLKPTQGPPKRFRHLTRAEAVVITRLRVGFTKATKSHILSRGPPTACQHCAQTIEHILLSWNVQCCNKVVMSTTQLTHWGPSLRRSRRLA